MISAEAEQCAMVPALAEARQVQLFLNENREGTHIILETDWSAAKAIVKLRYLCRMASQIKRVWLRVVGTKNNAADSLTKPVSQQILQNKMKTPDVYTQL